MFRAFFLLAALLPATGLLSAQTDTLPRARWTAEIGLNVSHTLFVSLLGRSPNQLTDPYFLSVRVGSERRRLRFGGNVDIDRSKENQSTIMRDERRRSAFAVRAGYEWVASLSARWGMYWGLDAVYDRAKTSLVSRASGGSGRVDSREWGAGAGPILGARWLPTRRLALTLESTLYARYWKQEETVRDGVNNFIQNKVGFGWTPKPPTAIYLNFIF